MTEEKKKLRSLDEIMEDVDRISQEDGHRDQFKALKLLATAKGSAVVLPEPLSRDERIERAMRVLKGLGFDDARVAMARTFARSVARNEKLLDQAPTLGLEDLTPEMQAKVKHVTSVKKFNQACPELKKSGIPRGYPTKSDHLTQKLWLQHAYAKVLIGREQRELDRQAKLAQMPPEDPENPSWMRSRPKPEEAPAEAL